MQIKRKPPFWVGKAPRPELMPNAMIGATAQGKRVPASVSASTWPGAPRPDFLPSVRSTSSILQAAQACDAKITGNVTGVGKYKSRQGYGIHGEMNALEDYLAKGGEISKIKEVAITSPPCKYCAAFLQILGIDKQVVVTKESHYNFGSCREGTWIFPEADAMEEIWRQTGLDVELDADEIRVVSSGWTRKKLDSPTLGTSSKY